MEWTELGQVLSTVLSLHQAHKDARNAKQMKRATAVVGFAGADSTTHHALCAFSSHAGLLLLLLPPNVVHAASDGESVYLTKCREQSHTALLFKSVPQRCHCLGELKAHSRSRQPGRYVGCVSCFRGAV